MKYQNKRFQNIGILIVVAAFVALGFIGNISNAQTRNRGKATPTPKKKATPTPKKARAKATPTPKSKAKSNQKTTAKTKATPTPKKKDTKAKTASKTDKNSKSKTASTKDRNKKDTRTSSKKTNTASTKTSSKPTNRNSRQTTPVKTRTTTTKTTASKTIKPATDKTTKPKTTVQSNKNLPQIVVSSFSTTVRSAPNSTASEVSRAKLGSIYKVVDKSSGWYKVEYSNQKTGWIPITAAVDSDTSGNEEIYRQVIAKNSASGKMNFNEAVEIYEFLTRVQPEIKDANTAADFGLRRLTALRSALGAIPVGQSSQKMYQDFLKAQDENIVYSDPSAEWYVRAPLFWDLHSKYTTTPSGEKIAWEAAKNPLPGECEGYVNCYIFLLRMTDAEYLNFYPTGTHSAEALRNITTLLAPIADDSEAKRVYNGPTDVSDRAEFNSLITEMRVIVSRLPNTEKEKALQQLKKIAEGFK